MKFYIGLHQPSDAKHFSRSCISINRIEKRKSKFTVGAWMMDSGAFTEISSFGRYRSSVDEYADKIKRWIGCGNLDCAVAQDYMCEPFITDITGLTIKDHQTLTIERYVDLEAHNLNAYILPVLQGYKALDYVSADSMAWSYAARKEGRNPNDWREAKSFLNNIETMPVQAGFSFF